MDIQKGKKVWIANGKGPDLKGEIVSDGYFWEKSAFRCKVQVGYVDLAGKYHTTIITVPITKISARYDA